jgi:hypothetical protein
VHITRRVGARDVPLSSYAWRAVAFALLMFAAAVGIYTLVAVTCDYRIGANVAMLNHPLIQQCVGTDPTLLGIPADSVTLSAANMAPGGASGLAGAGVSIEPSLSGTTMPCTQCSRSPARLEPLRSRGLLAL